MNEIAKSTIDKIIQLYMENDYEYVAYLAKAGRELPEQEDDHMMQFLIRNSIPPADMSAEDIQQVADIASKRIDEINSEIYRVHGKQKE